MILDLKNTTTETNHSLKALTLEITDKIHDDLAEIEPSVSLFINDKIWREIEDLAAKTYVQETEQSRLMGAGAGLITDND